MSYEDYGKLADGTPYPTKWSTPSPWPGMPEHPQLKSMPHVIEWRLRIEQRPPAEAWFEEPKVAPAASAP